MECVIVNATGALLDANLRALAPEVIAAIPARAGEAAWLDAMLDAAESRHPHAPLALAEALLGLLALLRLRTESVEPRTAGERLVHRALDLLAREWSPQLDARGLARRLGVHRDHLSRCFHRHAELPLAVHLRRSRLSVAQRLLAAGLGCGRVATQVGYADAFSFSKAYRREFGRPPSAEAATGG
jgi:transcriptional regulator GlxA family with amidase domain